MLYIILNTRNSNFAMRVHFIITLHTTPYSLVVPDFCPPFLFVYIYIASFFVLLVSLLNHPQEKSDVAYYHVLNTRNSNFAMRVNFITRTFHATASCT